MINKANVVQKKPQRNLKCYFINMVQIFARMSWRDWRKWNLKNERPNSKESKEILYEKAAKIKDGSIEVKGNTTHEQILKERGSRTAGGIHWGCLWLTSTGSWLNFVTRPSTAAAIPIRATTFCGRAIAAWSISHPPRLDPTSI